VVSAFFLLFCCAAVSITDWWQSLPVSPAINMLQRVLFYAVGEINVSLKSTNYSAFHNFAENVKFSQAVGPCLYRASKSCCELSLPLCCPLPPHPCSKLPSIGCDDISKGVKNTLAQHTL
jgi:hypothetical protein